MKGLFGVPGGSYKILMTLKGIWRILKGGEFLSGLLRILGAGRFRLGPQKVSGGSDGSESLLKSPRVSHYDLKDLLEVPGRSYTIHLIPRSYFFQQFKMQV